MPSPPPSPTVVDFFVPGDPVPQPRADARAVGVFDPRLGVPVTRARLFRKSSQPVNAYRDSILLGFKLAKPRGWPLDAAYRMLALLTIKPPKGLARCHREATVACAVKPDGDNYLKGIKDALKGAAWADDGRVYDARVVKQYAGPGRPVGTRVLIAARPFRVPVNAAAVVAEFLSANTCAVNVNLEAR